MRSIILAAAAALAFATCAGATTRPFTSSLPQCPGGVRCGDTCIAAGKVCHVTPSQRPICNAAKSKPCGNTCIPKGKHCNV